VIFTFMFATFPSGLVIYYAWNNFLTVLQQAFIMKREGVEVSFFDNIKPKKPKAAPKAAND
jgi:YidC/Oxa1 family membrane protein insertase